MAYYGIALSGMERQERIDWVSSQTKGDADGWVNWIDTPPQPDIPVQIKRDGEDGIYEITPRGMSLWWNVAGVSWRLPR